MNLGKFLQAKRTQLSSQKISNQASKQLQKKVALFALIAIITNQLTAIPLTQATPPGYTAPADSTTPCCGLGIYNVTLVGEPSGGTIDNDTANPSGVGDSYHDYTSDQLIDPSSITLGIPDIGQDTLYTFSGTPGPTYSQYFTVWIDYDQDGTFEAGELALENAIAAANTPSPFDFTVPLSATLGQTVMRVAGDYNTISDPNGGFQYTEYEDYYVNIVTPPAPTVPQPPTSLIATPANTQVTVSWTAPVNTGHSPLTDYKYYYGETSGFPGNAAEFDPGHTPSTTTSKTFTGLTNGTSYSFYIVAVNIIGDSSPSATIASTPTEYSPPVDATNSCCDIGIRNVTLFGAGTGGHIDNDTASPIDTTDSYHDYTTTQAIDPNDSLIGIPDLVQDTDYDISLTPGTTYGDNFKAWIDFDHDGIFEVGEIIVDQFAAANTPTGNITFHVPSGATLGHVRLRVGGAYSSFSDPQGPLDFGEFEDYTVNISTFVATEPSAPTGLSATPTNTQITINWTSPFDGGDPITSYTLRYGESSGINVCDPTTAPYTNCTEINSITPITNPQAQIVTGLTYGITYIFAVTATNGIGEGPSSSTITSQLLADPPNPTSIDPATGTNLQTLTGVVIEGNDFNASSTVQLTKSGKAPITCTSPVRDLISDPQTITCNLNLLGRAAGLWNVVVTNPDTQTGTITNGFSITLDSPYPAWNTNGSVVANRTDDNSTYYTTTETKVIRTGDGNYITAWVDNREGTSYDIYVQKFNSTMESQWTSGGIRLSDGVQNSHDVEIITDNGNGAIVTWEEFGVLYGQKLNSSGTQLWNSGSQQTIIPGISLDTFDFNSYDIVEDGAGGAFIAYKDTGDNNYSKVTRIDGNAATVTGDNTSWPYTIMGGNDFCTGGNEAQLLLASPGLVRVAWPAPDAPCNASGTHFNLSIFTLNGASLSDGLNGQSVTSDNFETYDREGNHPSGCGGATIFQFNPRMINDGNGGIYITWNEDCSGLGTDGTYISHLSDYDSPDSKWTAQLYQSVSFGGPQAMTEIREDGNGGAIITYPGYADPITQLDSAQVIEKVQNVGNIPTFPWGETTLLKVAESGPFEYQLTEGPSGGATVLYTSNAINFNIRLYAKQYDTNGDITGNWDATNGNQVSTLNSNIGAEEEMQGVRRHARAAVGNGSGGFVTVWERQGPNQNLSFQIDVDNFIQGMDSSAVQMSTSGDETEISPGIDVDNYTEKTQRNHQIVSTNEDNYITAWEDDATVPSTSSEFKIRAEKFDSSGNRLWNANPGVGIEVAPDATGFSVTNEQLSIAADETSNAPNGGLLAAWRQDMFGGYIYIQKLDTDGVKDLNWDSSGKGRLISDSDNSNSYPYILSDGNGGGFVVWLRNNDIYGVKFNSNDGTIDTNWNTGNPVQLTSTGLAKANVKMVRDGAGNLLIAYNVNNGGTGQDVLVTKVAESNGNVVSTTTIDNRASDQIVTGISKDNSDGILITYTDDTNGASNKRIYAHRLDSSAGLVWPAPALVSSSADNNLNAKIATANDGGATVVWEKYNSGETASDIAIQRLNASNGALLWNEKIISNTGATVLKQNPQIVRNGTTTTDPNHGSVVVWDQDGGGSGNHIYIQHVINSIGQWTSGVNGLQITNTSREDTLPRIAGDDDGGAAFIWQGINTTLPDIFGQRILEGSHAYSSTFTAPGGNVESDGIDSKLLTATLLNQSDVPITGKTITVNVIRGNGSNVTVTAVTCVSGGLTPGETNASGEACFEVTGTVGGSYTFAATDTTDPDSYRTIDDTIIVTFNPGTPTAGNSTFVADPTSVDADGTATSLLTATLKDSNNALVSGKAVSVSPSRPGPVTTITQVDCSSPSTPAPGALTDANGQACFKASSATAGTEVFTATDTTDSVTITQTASVDFIAGNGDPDHSTFTAFPTSIPADNTTTSTLTATVYDINDVPVAGTHVSVRKDSGPGTPTITPAIPVLTNGSGVATFTVSSATAGLDTFVATLDDVATVGGYSEVNPPTGGHVVPGSGGSWTNQVPTSDDDGTATVALPFTFNFYGVDYNTVYMCTNGYIQFVDGGGSCQYSTFAFGSGSGVPRIAGLFADKYRVVMETQDNGSNMRFHFELNNCCSGGSPAAYDFEITLFDDNHIEIHYNHNSSNAGVVGIDSGVGVDYIQSPLTTDPIDTNTSTSFEISSGGGTDITQTASVNFLDVSDGNSTVESFNTPQVADGSTPALIIVTLRDYSNNPISDRDVTVTKIAGPGTPIITPVNCVSGFHAAGSTNASGEACYEVTSTTAGAINTFQAEDTTDNITLTDTADIEFICDTGSSGEISGSSGTTCASVTVEAGGGGGTLTISEAPDNFSFPAQFTSASAIEALNNAAGATENDRITVSATAGVTTFSLQVQADGPFTSGIPADDIAASNFYTVTTVPDSSDANGDPVDGIQYGIGSTGPQNISAPHDLPNLSDLSDPTKYKPGTGVGESLNNVVDLMLAPNNSRSGDFTQYVNYNLQIPPAQKPNTYSTTVTFTLIP